MTRDATQPNSTPSQNCINIDTPIQPELAISPIEIEERDTLLSMDAEQRKREGVFFTPLNLAQSSAKKICDLPFSGAVLDPACGTGNLLVALADLLEVGSCIEDTLRLWGEKIHGIDINSDFIRIAKKKIVTLAISKCGNSKTGTTFDNLMSLLKNIKVGNFLEEYQNYKGIISSVIMNPPFCYMQTPPSISWTSGKLNAASLFISYAVDLLPLGGKILGILPDVLRSGSRYRTWRTLLGQDLEYAIEPFGNFQRGIQVDVFILTGTKVDGSLRQENAHSIINEVVDLSIMHKFKVAVGTVVPHRDKPMGIEGPYAHSKILPPWKVVNSLPERITHDGRKFIPPFVAVRRTSSPKDKERAVGTVVNCREPVSVENHLIVLTPIDGQLETCHRLLKHLRRPEVSEYINSQIRCRHLTVGVVKRIPLKGMNDGD